jgi:hypothetical protein
VREREACQSVCVMRREVVPSPSDDWKVDGGTFVNKNIVLDALFISGVPPLCLDDI